MPEEEESTPVRRQSSPVALSRAQRWLLGGGSLAAFALAAASELWRENDGVGVVSLVVVAAALGALAVIGSVPMRLWWGDKGLEFATEEAEDDLERQIKDVSPELRKAILDQARADSSPATRAAARRVEDKIERGRQMALRVTGDVRKSLDRFGSDNEFWVERKRTGSPIRMDFEFKSRDEGIVYGDIVPPFRDETFSPRDYFALVSEMSPKDGILLVVSELDETWRVHHTNMVLTYMQVAKPGVKLVTCPWRQKSIDAAIEYLYTGELSQSDGESPFYSFMFMER